MTEITPAQCRAARAFLSWKQEDLAEFSELSPGTIRTFEAGGVIRASNQKLLRLVFRTAGIEFDEDPLGRQSITFDPAVRTRFLASK